MNKQLIVGSVIGAAAVTAVGAFAGYRMLEDKNYARVLEVTPTMEQVKVPRQECHDVQVTRTHDTKDPKQIAGSVVGAVVGGAIGNQVGGGDGKKLATIAGAVGGGYAGNKIQERLQEGNTYQDTERTCVTRYDTHQQPAGFDVRYRIAGQEHQVHMNYDPGSRIPLENGKLVLRTQSPQ